MRRALFLLIFLLAACTRTPLIPGSPRHAHEPDAAYRRQSDSTGNPLADTPPGEHVYLTAVRYPDGFNWELDTCAVEGTVWIDLYRDGQRILSIPAGDSVHPDMHRFLHGHLYSDASTDTETVVLRDGEELFRFPGRESLRGFLVREDGIHTLGQDRDGDGFTWRVNGRELLRSETGTVLGTLDGSGAGGLVEDGEEDWFTCRVPSERGPEFRVMRGAETVRAEALKEGTWTLGYVGGRVCRIYSAYRKQYLEVDGTPVLLACRMGESPLWCRMLVWKGDILLLVNASGVEGKRCFLQTAGGQTFDPGNQVADCLTDGERMGWTETDGEGNLLRFRWSDGGILTPGPDLYLAAGCCARLHDGHLLLALTGRNGTPNRFQRDAESTEIPFNGYFTSVTVE